MGKSGGTCVVVERVIYLWDNGLIVRLKLGTNQFGLKYVSVE